MEIYLIPLHHYGPDEEQRRRHTGMIAKIYSFASNHGAIFASVSHSDGLTKAILTPSAPPARLPRELVGPLERLLTDQLNEICQEEGDFIEKGYLFIRSDPSHHVIRDALQRVFDQRDTPLKIHEINQYPSIQIIQKG